MVLQKSLGLLLAFSELSVLELQQFHAWTAKTKTPLLVRPSQNQLFPGLVLEGKNGWILEAGEKSLRDLLLINPELRLPKNPDEDPKFNLTDLAINELSRLYYKAMALRS
jgi:hypothetical protein